MLADDRFGIRKTMKTLQILGMTLRRGDIDGFFGLFVDNLLQMLRNGLQAIDSKGSVS